jgi:hypothetical protein
MAKKKTAEAAAVKERRRFGMHSKLLLDVIRRQAGSVAKAILEGVMNAVDAQAKTCRVTLDAAGLTIEDDGIGITSREHVEKFFETFGQPHDESEGKVYGTFRMGRGQLFAYGENDWRTGPFRMLVDIAKHGLDYTLETLPEAHKGCRIRVAFNDPLKPSELDETEREIARWVKYAQCEVYFNGERVSRDPASEKWDHVTPEAYIRLKPTGSLAVYNLGVHVLDYHGYRLGTGGEVVSRAQLKVNFARNDIQSDCPVWKKIKPFVDLAAAARMKNKKTGLNDDERQRLADKAIAGELPWSDVSGLRLVTLVNGRQVEVREACNPYIYGRRWSNCPRGNRRGDKLLQRRAALVIADETLERWRVKDLAGLQALFAKLYRAGYDYRIEDSAVSVLGVKIVPFAKLTAGLDEVYEIVDPKKYTPREQVWMSLMQQGDLFGSGGWSEGRRFVLGESKAANGWTDGASYVAVAREFLAPLNFDVEGFTRLGCLLIHEFCHKDADTCTHGHEVEFFEQYHELTRKHLGEFVTKCLRQLPKTAKRLERTLDRAAQRARDEADTAERLSKAGRLAACPR